MATNEPIRRHESTDRRIEEAIARWKAGDKTAKNDLIAHAKNQVERMTRRLLRHDQAFKEVRKWEQTDDVAQGVFMRLSRMLDQTEIESVRHFFAIAANHIDWQLRAIRDLLQAAKRKTPNRLTNVQRNPKGGPPLVDEKLNSIPAREDGFEKLAQLLDGLETISGEDREIINLILVNGLNLQEAADVMKVSLATLNRRYRQVRAKLAAEIGGTDDEPRGEATPEP